MYVLAVVFLPLLPPTGQTRYKSDPSALSSIRDLWAPSALD